jgi:UDP-N-acetylmuramoyl-L-alanyl-D-glutamate--2,6-diaminopimelate ligase
MAGKRADIVVITNEDPYDDDPVEIIDNVASGAIEAGKEVDKDLFKEEDRVKGIEKALKLAKKGDLVLITGKGAEQYICSKNNTKIPHDDRTIVKNLLK